MTATLASLLSAPPDNLDVEAGPPTGEPADLIGRLRRRADLARASLDGVELPSADEEAWRYSRIAELDLDDFAAVPASPSGEVPPLADPLLHLGSAATVHLADGQVSGIDLSPEASALGVRVVRVREADLDIVVARDTELLGSFLAEGLDPFAQFALGGSVDPVLIVVPPRVVVPGPITVVQDGTTSGAAVPSHVLVLAGEASEATVIEWVARQGANSLTVPLVELVVAQAANLRYVQIQHQPDTTWQIGNLRSVVAKDATLGLFHAGFGGSYVRQRTDCRLVGRGATGNLDALYFGDADQTLDFRTFQIHDAPDTTSNLMFTGAVGGRARTIYTGLIRIEKAARGSNAFQTNRNLKLSDEAWADSVPNLEIENNDVHCSHASTVGPVDADQRFYLESRGVPASVAERLVVEGFLAGGVAACPVPELGGWVHEQLVHRLDAADVSLGSVS